VKNTVQEKRPLDLLYFQYTVADRIRYPTSKCSSILAVLAIGIPFCFLFINFNCTQNLLHQSPFWGNFFTSKHRWVHHPCRNPSLQLLSDCQCHSSETDSTDTETESRESLSLSDSHSDCEWVVTLTSDWLVTGSLSASDWIDSSD